MYGLDVWFYFNKSIIPYWSSWSFSSICSHSCLFCLSHWQFHLFCGSGLKPLIHEWFLLHAGHQRTSLALLSKYVQNPILPHHLYWYHPRPSYCHLLLGLLVSPLVFLLLFLAGVILLKHSKLSITSSPFHSQWKSSHCNVLQDSTESGPSYVSDFIFLLPFPLWSHWPFCYYLTTSAYSHTSTFTLAVPSAWNALPLMVHSLTFFVLFRGLLLSKLFLVTSCNYTVLLCLLLARVHFVCLVSRCISSTLHMPNLQ